MRWVFSVLAVIAMLVAVPARAQSIPSPPAQKPSAADEATAKKDFQSGLKLYGEGAYAEALIAFEQSYRIGGRPSALKNIAQCHRNLRHFVEAYEAYEQMLKLHDAQLPAADKKAVQQALDELGVLTGTILVTVSETDAEIEIDGKPVARSPMTSPKRVTVASHVVRVTKPGFAPFEQPVAVASQKDEKIDVKLEPEKKVGHVAVREQSGRDVHVFVDGEDKGPAPWEGDVPAGEHTVEAKSARFASEARRVMVTAKEHLDVSLDAAPLTGHLRVTTVPATASISVDGKRVGTGAWEGDLPEGSHRIEVGLEGNPPQVREVVLGRGQLVVQEIPVVAAIAGAQAEYAGLYGQVSLAAMIGFGNADNAHEPDTHDDHGFIGMGALAVHVGKAWDWYAIEGVGMLSFEHRDHGYWFDYSGTTNPGGPQRVDFSDESNAVNGFIGAGGRATSKSESVRFTVGLAPGIAIRTFNPRRRVDGCLSCTGPQGGPNGGNQFTPPVSGTSGSNGSGNNEQSFGGAGYTTFALAMDGGVLFGSTPGVKFFVGVQALVDFPPTIAVGPDTLLPLPNGAYKEPGRGITLVDAPQFYVGPTIGLRFGH